MSAYGGKVHNVVHSLTFISDPADIKKPNDLPIEWATKFETIVNLKIAKALGIKVSTSSLLVPRGGNRMNVAAPSYSDCGFCILPTYLGFRDRGDVS